MSATINTHFKVQCIQTGKAVGIMHGIHLRDYVQGHIQKRSGSLLKKYKKNWGKGQALARVAKTLNLTARSGIRTGEMFICWNTVPNGGQKYALGLMGVSV